MRMTSQALARMTRSIVFVGFDGACSPLVIGNVRI
jgi:hypothetical protein